MYAKLLLTVLDIPVYENVVESLHVMFSLYSEFMQSQHFAQMIHGPSDMAPAELTSILDTTAAVGGGDRVGQEQENFLTLE